MSTVVEEPWTPEPELRDPPPRRLVASEYADLNIPNVLVFNLVAGALFALGLVLLMLGMAGRGALFTVPGLLGMIAGGAAFVVFPQKAARRRALAEHLVSNGQPIMARIVNATNLTGDSVYGRSVTFMVTLPGGESIRRDTNADERTLPKRLPGNVTALIDMNTSQVELYCALPFRAIPRQPAGGTGGTPPPPPDPLADLPISTPPPPSSGGGQMGRVD